MNEEERNGLMKQRRKAREKIKQLETNWNELKKWLEDKISRSWDEDVYEDMLEKMRELEGK